MILDSATLEGSGYIFSYKTHRKPQWTRYTHLVPKQRPKPFTTCGRMHHSAFQTDLVTPQTKREKTKAWKVEREKERIESWDCRMEITIPLFRLIVAFGHFILIHPKHVDILWLIVDILQEVGHGHGLMKAWKGEGKSERRKGTSICHLCTLHQVKDSSK